MKWDIFEFFVDLLDFREYWRLGLGILLGVALCCSVCPLLPNEFVQVVAGVVFMLTGLDLGLTWEGSR